MKNLTKREIVLIIILINVVLYYILFNIVGGAISRGIREKSIQYEELLAQRDLLKIAETKSEIDMKRLQDTIDENNKIKDKIFSTTNPENIHSFINKLAKESGLKVIGVNIVDDTMNNENEETTHLYSDEPIRDTIYTIDIEVSGSYEEKIKFIKSIETLDKTIIIKKFSNINTKEDATSLATIKLYSIDKLKISDEFIIK